MDVTLRHQKVWKLLCKPVGKYLEWKFRFVHDTVKPDGPCLIVSNHVTNWDPLLLAICFPEHQTYFVASEHLFRMGWKSKVIQYLVAPIPRSKGTNSMGTAMDCMRKIRAGHSVCVFGEGETTWDGRSQKVFPGTGMLAQMGGGSLITFRLEGGYLSMPRWGRGLRKGRMRGRVVNTYTPQQLSAMTAEEIEAAMNADIYEDAWVRQKEEPIRYTGKHLAEHIGVAAFLCPQCRKVGTVVGRGNEVSCQCGWHTSVTELGTFDPPVPFENMAQWNDWQLEALQKNDFVHGETIFRDENVSLIQVLADHKEKQMARGEMYMEKDALNVGGTRFLLEEISNMALIQRRRLTFMHKGRYYEAIADKPSCMRKYLEYWRCRGKA